MAQLIARTRGGGKQYERKRNDGIAMVLVMVNLLGSI